ncbi:MAG: FAD:protein FMN transferase [Flavobacteriaceae bacterium]|nr:FAD:protein FMN transferase [Flavobacteriaceae bacterium]
MKKIALFVVLSICFSCQREIINTKISGPVFGTSYSIQYYSEDTHDVKKACDSLFEVINQSMSTYDSSSIISKINKNEDVEIDTHFKTVLEASKLVYRHTQGAFDPTIGAVVNAWDFGPEGKIENLDSVKVKEMMRVVGLNRVGIVNNKLQKPEIIKMDFNAIAKGYGVDVISDYLESKGVKDYIVEIGGEIRTRGINKEKGTQWVVGVEAPRFDGEQSLMNTIVIKDKALATSGTYRKFKVDALGRRYAHIIDAKTGYPSQTNLLSISVIADNCTLADAYATAFKTMGIEKIKRFLETHSELQVFLIFENEGKEIESLTLNGFPE